MSPIPYGFMPVDAERAVHDAPLWRDGSSSEPRLSGELLLTLTALTPLIVGNHQHKPNDKHSVLLPQMLDDGRVLLGATSLKGMLRTTLSGLLQAPMSRVAEHHYTYRPNLGFCSKLPKHEQRAAIVKSVEGEGSKAKVRVALLPSDCPVVFVREDVKMVLGSPVAGEHIQRTIANIAITGNAPRMRLESQGAGQANLDHFFLTYCGGIDGEGHLAQAFREWSRVYRSVLILADEYLKVLPENYREIPEHVWSAYCQTQEILADDKHGHLSPGHPLAKKLELDTTQTAIREHAHLQPDQLIYVEIENGKTPSGNPGVRIVSMGHHFQYRWGYTSSVRRKNRLLDGRGQLRTELALHPQEHAGDDGAPQQLTAARLLFGYAVDGQEPDQEGLAQGCFKRLAGRIAFNTAIEAPANKTIGERFIDGGKEVQLNILGMPRPSAVEFYLKQPSLPKALTTYGDLPKDPGGDLAGRKYYRHQPDAKSQRNRYVSGKANTNVQERGTCVRYLSAPDSQFRCTLRFDSLRPWELGALLASLDPSLIDAGFALHRHNGGYAHKLGYGKPLGLGSVRIRIDAARWHKNDSWDWQSAKDTNDPAWQDLSKQSLSAFREKLEAALGAHAKDHLVQWLKPLQWSECGQACYPTAEDKKGERTIFNFHTDLRRAYAVARRGGNATKQFNDLKNLLDTKS